MPDIKEYLIWLKNKYIANKYKKREKLKKELILILNNLQIKETNAFYQQNKKINLCSMRNWKKFNEEELKVERNNEENYLYTLIKFEMAL